MVQVVDHLGVAELQAGWRESKDATLARHYQVIWLLAGGRSCAEVARMTGFVRRWVEELVARYNRFGPTSLGDRRRGNGARPKILTPEILAMLRERVKTPPDDGGVWTAKKVAAVIAAALGVPGVAEQRGYGLPPKIFGLMAMPANSASITPMVIKRTAVCIAVRRTKRMQSRSERRSRMSSAASSPSRPTSASTRLAPSSAARVRIASNSASPVCWPEPGSSCQPPDQQRKSLGIVAPANPYPVPAS